MSEAHTLGDHAQLLERYEATITAQHSRITELERTVAALSAGNTALGDLQRSNAIIAQKTEAELRDALSTAQQELHDAHSAMRATFAESREARAANRSAVDLITQLVEEFAPLATERHEDDLIFEARVWLRQTKGRHE